MKVLAASSGDRPGDFSWAIPGEIVHPVAEACLRSDECGCGRAFAGLASNKATTVAIVTDLELDFDDLVAAVRAEVDNDDEAIELAQDIAEEAAGWPVGTRVRCRGGEVEPE